ncbi:MAG: alpha/beta hydrolase [Gammaproteobacteria bacterium PRO9]|nr:alpha/beta hydrolase [Gammaproteobacteria bacterium PRO9]
MQTLIRRAAAWSFVLLLAGLASAPTHAADDMPIPASISPEARAYLQSLPPRRSGSSDFSDPAAATRVRAMLGKMFLAGARRITTDYTLEAVDAGGVPAYWVRTPGNATAGSSRPGKERVLLYLHGGGFVIGAAATDLSIPLRMGIDARLPVLSVDYRLAPEHPYPAALDDSVAAYRWLLKQGFKPGNIGVVGDSAGGQLAVALVLAAHKAGLPRPGAVVAMSPVTDMTDTGDSYVTMANFDPIQSTDRSNRVDYMAGHDPKDPLLSPIFADLRGFPPLLIQVGTRDLLLSDSVRLARKARVDGVDVTLDVWDGMWHVWQGNPTVPEARAASMEAAAFLRRHLGLPAAAR